MLTYKYEPYPYFFFDITLFGHVARKREKRNAYRFFGGESLKERDLPEDRGMDGRINIKTAV